jgi:hypothetical protein
LLEQGRARGEAVDLLVACRAQAFIQDARPDGVVVDQRDAERVQVRDP